MPSERVWTRGGLVAYLGALAPFILVFIGGALGWSVAPLEHLRPTPANVTAGVAVFVVGVAIVRSRWGNQHAALRSTTIVPEFDPPDGLRPAELDLLLHAVARRRDVVATIVDLALRGFLRISEAKNTDGQPTWTFERAEGPFHDLRRYEQLALAALFDHGPRLRLAMLEPRFYVAIDLVEDELERESVRRGWFAERPGRLRSRWATAGWVSALAGVPVTFLFGNAFSLGLVGAAVSAVGLVVYALAPWRPARTAAGAALGDRAAGFERFLRTAEAERQRFAERERIFEDFLPYAIALGLVHEWVRGFRLVDRPGAFDESEPGFVRLPGGVEGLVGQLETAAERKRR